MLTVKKDEELIYDLIFSNQVDFSIDISEYIDDIYNYSDFISKMKKILKKSKVDILSSTIRKDSKSVIWELKVKK